MMQMSERRDVKQCGTQMHQTVKRTDVTYFQFSASRSWSVDIRLYPLQVSVWEGVGRMCNVKDKGGGEK